MNKEALSPLSKFVVVMTITFLANGCATIGPEHLRDTHPLYNDAIVDSINEQLLNNLVRLRYRDPTFFLDVASVAASMRMNVAGSASGQVNSATPLTLGTDATYEILPTISYAPLQGEDFVKSLLSPVSIDALVALSGSGWTLRRVFGLCVESINGIDNAPSASGPTPERAPKHYKEWNRLVDTFEKLEDDHLVEARIDKATKDLKISFEPSEEFNDVEQSIKTQLKLDLNRSVFDVEGDDVQRKPDTLEIVTRPLMSTFFYLSHRVDVPDEHKSNGWVTITKNKDGSDFDWGDTPAGRLFHVLVSKEKPDDAFIAVPYESYWYFIPKNDKESKSTFLLLSQLFRLQAGAAKSIGPTLTIPVR